MELLVLSTFIKIVRPSHLLITRHNPHKKIISSIDQSSDPRRTPRIHPLTYRAHPTHRLRQQEAKKEDRLAREEFALTGGNKKLTKKERKRLEQEE